MTSRAADSSAVYTLGAAAFGGWAIARTIGGGLAMAALTAFAPLASAHAQATPASPPPVRADSTRAARRPAALSARPRAPLSPRRAFVTSALLPGLGQSRLDRGSSGALFASVELAAIVMLRRSNADYHEARRFQVDTLARDFTVSGGKLIRSDTTTSGYTADLVRTRRLHREDWLATIAFNHLFAGADAFVSAQLWDMPVQLTAAPSRTGVTIVATVHF